MLEFEQYPGDVQHERGYGRRPLDHKNRPYYLFIGIGCQEATQVVNSQPLNASSPKVADVTLTDQVTSYDSTTGLGTSSYIVYSGGSCSGANFNSNGATELSFGTVQFVVTEGGKLAHLIVTELEGYPTNYVGGVSITATFQKQTP